MNRPPKQHLQLINNLTIMQDIHLLEKRKIDMG